MPRVRRVAILIETSREYGRAVLRGITRYNTEGGQWLTYFQPGGLNEQPPPWLARWSGDGILARINNQATADAIRRAGVPVVNLRSAIPGLPFPFIGADNNEIGRLAAEHLLSRGLRHFGFLGYAHGYHPGFDQRGTRFRELITAAGHVCTIFQPRRISRAPSWEQDQQEIARWISGLPKPAGIMAANDDRGLQALDACRRIEAAVPGDVAVIGVDNDEHLCGLSIPPLTSIDPGAERIGYQAAGLLDRLMRGKAAPRDLPRTTPRGVIVRRSTDVLAIEDPHVLKAVRFIRENACRWIRGSDVLRHVGLSRAALQPRLKQVLGRTIHEEMRRVQIERVRELLAGTNLPIKQVAHEAGFRSVQYMTRAFHEEAGKTPALYRRDSQS